jgi:copper ion binding protein
MAIRTYQVAGMSCQHCVNAVQGGVGKLAGVSSVDVDLSQGAVTVSGDGLDDTAIRAAIDEAGYEVVG